MVNPYSGIITAALKTTFNNMIDALLEDDALTVPCTLIYEGQKMTDCPNCHGGTFYQNGGPIPFPNGKMCPYCHGTTKFAATETESLYLVCIFDEKKFLNLPTSPVTPNMYAQTMCALTHMPKLKAASRVILDSDNQLYSRNEYQRYGEPEPLGFGDMRYVLTSWKRVV